MTLGEAEPALGGLESGLVASAFGASVAAVSGDSQQCGPPFAGSSCTSIGLSPPNTPDISPRLDSVPATPRPRWGLQVIDRVD